jgi:hypothetical protein
MIHNHNNNNVTDAQLLTEEWMMGERINHEKNYTNRSLLPSFLDVMFMEETDKYISTTIRTIITDFIHQKLIKQILLERLVRYQQNIRHQHAQSNHNNNNIDSSDHDTNNVVPSSPSSSSLSYIWWKIRTYVCDYIFLYWKKLKHIVKNMTTNVHHILIIITRNIEHVFHQYTLEVYYTLRYILERQSLLRSSSTIAESLYGLIRVKNIQNNITTTNTEIKSGTGNGTGTGTGTRIQLLNKNDQIRVALVNVIVPYIIEKIQQQYHRYITQSQQEMNSLYIASSSTSTNPIRIPIMTNTIISKVQAKIRKMKSYIQHGIYETYNIGKHQQHLYSYIIQFIYPFTITLYKGFNVYYQWKYLINLSHYTNVNNRLLSNILLRRQQRQQQQQQTIENKSIPHNNNPTATPISNDTNITSSMFHSIFIKKGLPFVIATPFVLSYCIQMVYWYCGIRRDLLLQRQQNNDQYDIYHHIQNDNQNDNQMLLQSPGVIPVPIFPINSIRTSLKKDSCPICGQSIHSDNNSNDNKSKSNQPQSLVENSTTKTTKSIVALNGYMYCSYICIVSYLRENNNICPITGKTVIDETKQVVRLLI